MDLIALLACYTNLICSAKASTRITGVGRDAVLQEEEAFFEPFKQRKDKERLGFEVFLRMEKLFFCVCNEVFEVKLMTSP